MYYKIWKNSARNFNEIKKITPWKRISCEQFECVERASWIVSWCLLIPDGILYFYPTINSQIKHHSVDLLHSQFHMIKITQRLKLDITPTHFINRIVAAANVIINSIKSHLSDWIESKWACKSSCSVQKGGKREVMLLLFVITTKHLIGRKCHKGSRFDWKLQNSDEWHSWWLWCLLNAVSS